MKRIVSILLVLFAADIQAQNTSDNSLFFLPTAHTMEKGTHQVSSFELLFLQYSYAITSTTHISAFSMFPITAEAVTNSFSIGLKQRIATLDMFTLSASATYWMEPQVVNLMGIASIGQPSKSFHAGLGSLHVGDVKVPGLVFMLGTRNQLSERISFMAEYINATQAIEEADFSGLLTVGVRFHVQDLAFDLGGMRPLGENSGEMLFLPVIRGTFEF
jgi:hypothetical protein